MAPWIRYLYFRGIVDGMSVIATVEEFASQASPFIHRFLEEFSLTRPEPEDLDWLARSALRALREERPRLVVLPDDEGFSDRLAEPARILGVEVLTLNSQGLQCESGCLSCFEELDQWLARLPATAPWKIDLLARVPLAWDGALGSIVRVGNGRQGVGLLSLASSPQETLRQLLQESGPLDLVEPVNLPALPGGATFRYGDYDNEFALGAAKYDLRQLLREQRESGTCLVEIVNPSSGAALGLHWECPDSIPPCFLIKLGVPRPPLDWLSRFPLSGKRHRIVVADSQNIAGSVLNHCLAINRYTAWESTALCAQRHPFIDYPQEECRVHFAEAGLTSELRRTLEDAEVFLFFEDDDECSPSWPFDMRPFVQGKPVLHLYIGQRVHRQVVSGQRPGRTVLTPLPHLLRMFPNAKFYAGFPPSTLDEVGLRPPRSQQDGVLRVLHTPSLPHQTTPRYYYHKDTEAFLEAAQRLKSRHPRVEFWQLGGMDHRKILQARLDCDITFNQLRGYHGLSGDEAMYLERPMVQAFDQNNVNRHREYWGLDADFPWIDACPGTLTEVLDRLLRDPQGRLEIGRRSRQFMLEYFSPRRGIVPLIYHCEMALGEAGRRQS